MKDTSSLPPHLDELVQKVQDELIRRAIPIPRWGEHSEEVLSRFQAWVTEVLDDLNVRLEDAQFRTVAREVAQRILGLGVLEPFLHQEDVEEIIVRPPGHVMLERQGRVEYVGQLASDEYFREVIVRRVAEFTGVDFRAANPQFKVGLPDGSRFTAMIPPLAVGGVSINIRRFTQTKMTFDDLIEAGSMDQETADFLQAVARGIARSCIFAGRPGAGKTTYLNAFSGYLPETAQINTVETFRELQLQQPFVARAVVLEEAFGARRDGAIRMDEVINALALRMRPDVLVIGEVVLKEAAEYLQALNVGLVAHTTIHANSARLALTRLETLSGDIGIPLEERRRIIGHGVGLVVFLAKTYDPERNRFRRFMRELAIVRGVTPDGGDYDLAIIKEGKVSGEFTPLRKDLVPWVN